MKNIKLTKARLIWKSGVEENEVSGNKYQTFCYKLPENLVGIRALFDNSNTLYSSDELEKLKNSFITSVGNRCYFNRKFYNFKQVGSFLIIKDYPVVEEPTFTIVAETK